MIHSIEREVKRQFQSAVNLLLFTFCVTINFLWALYYMTGLHPVSFLPVLILSYSSWKSATFEATFCYVCQKILATLTATPALEPWEVKSSILSVCSKHFNNSFNNPAHITMPSLNKHCLLHATFMTVSRLS